MSDILTGLSRRLEAKRLRLVFAAESGSRAWGFASPDSDFDIRFVFASERDSYVALFDPTQDIQYQEKSPIGPLDYAGWDLKKTLTLASRSNPSLLEWLGSPIVYSDRHGFGRDLGEFMGEHFSPRALAHHYINFMRNIRGKYMSDFVGEYTMKRYFYALRPILVILWMQANPWQLPPVQFRELLGVEMPEGALSEIETLLRLKAEQIEAVDHKSPLLDRFIADWFDKGHDTANAFPARQVPIDGLNTMLRRFLT